LYLIAKNQGPIMSDTKIVSDHLNAALLATKSDRPFLAYLIQMALIEAKTVPEQVHQKNEVNELKDYLFPYGSTEEFLSKPLQFRARSRVAGFL